MTYWWQGDLAGYVDFTSESAARWWKERLENLRTLTGIDSFKFDAGEANWMPSSYILHSSAETSTWPHAFTTAYAEAAAEFGGMIEVSRNPGAISGKKTTLFRLIYILP